VTDRTSLEFLLFSGAYDQVLARTAARHDVSEAPAMIGALSLSGRLEEAESAFESLRAASPDPDALLEARFFIVAGLCHAGRVQKAFRLARDSLEQVFGSNPRSRFWASQGFAVVRYFEGRFRLARRFARRALAAAVRAEFPYARFLALDLSAHVALQTGAVFAGMRLLSQAEALAQALGWDDNVATLRTSRTVYQLRLLTCELSSAISQVERELEAPEVSYFTRRNGLLELASMLALGGDAARAGEALEHARRIALPGSDNRGKTRTLLAHALLTALSRDSASARESLNEARASAGEELTLAAELGFVELVFAGGVSEAELRTYERVAALTGIQRAEVAIDVARGRTRIHAAGIQDGLCRVLIDCVGRPAEERTSKIVTAGLIGLLPWALEREPGRRIVVTATELITENQGAVRAHPLPVKPSLRLLFEISAGYRSRESLAATVWNIHRFVPSRHAPVLHTAVSRLRLAMGEPEWIITHPEGYELAEGVELVTFDSAHVAGALPSETPPPDERQRLLTWIEKNGASSSAEVAKALGLSSSTALRMLRKLASEGLLARHGGGRSTRYERA
jgi:hypothetical protein